MKKYKSLVVSSFIAAIIISIPFASFADNNNQGNKNKVGIETKSNSKLNKGSFSNSFWNRMSGLFGSNTTITDNSESPTITGITSPTVLKTGEMGTWIVKASDQNNGTLSYKVSWGDESNILLKSIASLSKPIFVQDATFTHTYSKNGKYTITFTVKNSLGKETSSKVTVNVVGQKITTSPTISNLNITSIKTHKAVINWNTDVKANSSVWISKISPVDNSGKPNLSRKALVLNHKMELKKLEANTKYYVIVESKNKAGIATSTETSFTTLPSTANTSAPIITELKGPNTVLVGETETVTVKAYDSKNKSLSYSVDWGDTNLISKNTMTVSDKPIFVQSATFSHVYTTAGTYTATFTVENTDGNKDSSSMKIVVTSSPVDTTNPTISNIKTSTDSTTSTISWTTDEPSTSEVFYSMNTPVDVNTITTPSVSSKLLVKNHSIKITGLTSSTIYHFVIKSADASNNTTIATESAFITNL